MSDLTTDQARALRLAIDCILEAAETAGPMGAPSGVVYLALMEHGMRLETYQSILGAMERASKIRIEGDCIMLATNGNGGAL